MHKKRPHRLMGTLGCQYMAGYTGVEPVASASGGQRSIQLS